VTRNGRPERIEVEPVIQGPSYHVGQGRVHLRTRHGTLDVIAHPGAPPEIKQQLVQPSAR
jgi:hypothetical protein